MKNLISHYWLWLAALVYFLVNCIQSFYTPLIDDEAYYWVWSQNLAWGYYDHPPMIALWIKLGFSLFQNEFGARLVTCIFGGIGFWLLGSKVLEIKNKNEFWLYCALFYSTTLFQVFGFISTPDSPLLFFGIFYFYQLKKFLVNPNLLNSLGWGFAMALVLYSKYHGILLIIFSILPIVFKLLRQKWFFVAVLFGVICFIPHMLWQINHDFVSLEYHIVRRNVFNTFKITNSTDYLLSLIWASAPLLFYHNIKAVIKTQYNTDFKRSLLWIFLGIIGFFIVITFKRYIQGQWSLLAFIPLLILSFYYYRNKSKVIQLLKKLGIITLILFAIARIFFAWENPPFKTQYHGWKDFMIRAGEVTDGIAVFEKYQFTSLFNFYNYPEKHAENYITIENRKSQYEIWNSESKLNHQDITYFSKYIKMGDTIWLKQGGNTAFLYHKVKDFQTAYQLKLNVTDVVVKNDSIWANASVYNDGDFAVNCSKNNHFSMVQSYIEYPYSEYIKCTQPVDFTDFKIEPRETKNIKIHGKICKVAAADYLTYFSLVFDNLPQKNQSNYVELKID